MGLPEEDCGMRVEMVKTIEASEVADVAKAPSLEDYLLANPYIELRLFQSDTARRGGFGVYVSPSLHERPGTLSFNAYGTTPEDAIEQGIRQLRESVKSVDQADAVQWDGTRQSGREIAKWAAGPAPTPVYVTGSGSGAVKLIVRTAEGKMSAQPGDWIVKGLGGRFRLVGARDLEPTP